MSLHRVVVVGAPSTGKSSVIKRMISHRFDNLPTLNKEFMGLPSDGKHVGLLTMPAAAGTLAGRKKNEPKQVLLEMQDQLNYAGALISEPFWFDIHESAAVVPGMDGLSPRSKLLAATSAAADRASKLDEPGTTEHWTKKIDPRKKQQAAAAAAGSSGGGSVIPGMRSGPAPEHDQHALMKHQFEEEARRIAREQLKVDSQVSPLTAEHGTHGWIVVFDLTSVDSFEAARALVLKLLHRAKYDTKAKRACPISITLVANKFDLAKSGRRSAVPPTAVCQLLAEACLPGTLVAQLRKQKVDMAIRRLVDAILQARKVVEESWAQAKMSSVEQQSEDEQVELGGVTNLVARYLAKLKAELDPMRVSSGHSSEFEMIMAIMAALEHPLAEKAELPPMELFECLMACPALAVKYVEVSCKTNHQVHLLERVVLRSIRLLPAAELVGGTKSRKERASRENEGGLLGALTLGGLTAGLFGGVKDITECIPFARAKEDAAKPAAVSQ